MARQKSEGLTTVEQQIMEVLWAKQQASVRDIADELNKSKQTAYTTVQTMCKVLLTKGYVSYHKEGRAFVYSAQMSQQEAKSNAVTNLLSQFFSGSSQVLAEHLLEDENINAKELDALQAAIDAKRKQSD
ncbi:MAG: MarR family transcriptional regulator [SAR86 cluster bacterium]|uniref:MarR family transcriptional regulator n=1 Tax=SAR86 cluster bacterium TaxID=2030880 RepID=A0A2A5ART9_9GAMM|nr:MAG: MarR family transcriptional regulator [SAR86 cluster bacterium]